MKKLTAIFLATLMLISSALTTFAAGEECEPIRKQCTLTVDVIGNGTVIVNGEEITKTDDNVYTVWAGTEVSLTITPESNYELKSMELDGIAVENGFVMPEKDAIMTVMFEEKKGVETEDSVQEKSDLEVVPQQQQSHEDEGLVVNSKGIVIKRELLCDDPNCLEEHVGETLNPSTLPKSETRNSLLANAKMMEDVYAGMTVSGYNASVLFLGVPGTNGAFSVNVYDGALAGTSGTGWCLNHGAANPGENGATTCTWTAECTAVHGNIATWSFTMTPPGVCEWGSVLGYQRVGMVADVPFEDAKGTLELQKGSAAPDITDGNSCYSLQGAVYGLYKNGKEITRLTTDEKGYAKATGIKKDSYILKEITPPKGYALDKREYSVSINSKQTTHVDVKDHPKSDPVVILLGKIDRETTQNMPQGSASLENAEFTIKYYAEESDTDPAEKGSVPVRTWIMKTDNRGFSMMSEKYKVSGDDFYYNSEGFITFPLGTVTLQETKAPEGYLLNEEVFVRKITTDDGPAENVETYNKPTIEEDVIRGDIQIAKYGESNNETGDSGADIKHPLKDIKFHLTSKTTGDVFTIITDEQGIASTTQLGISDRGNLPFDTYVVTEESPYPEYDPIAPFEVTIDTEGKTYYYIVRNDTVDAPISVQKVDAETGKIIPIAGAKFQVLDEDKNVITMTVSHYPTLIEQDTWETDANGGFMLPETLEYGVYYLREVKAPEGYLLNGEDIRFVVDKEHQWDEPLTVTFADTPAKGKIQILKTDEETGNSLKGAEFEVKAAEDIVTPDGTVRAAAGTIIDTITSNQNGIAETKELYLGKYEVIETRQPDGYIMPENAWTVELTYKDQNTEIVIKELEAVNKPTHIIIDKKVTGTEEKLEGVTFKIWNKETDAAKEYVTDKDGKIELLRFVPGTYCIQEVEGLPGYKWDDTIYEITIDENGLVDGEEIGNLTVENSKTEITETNVIDVETGSQTIYPKKVKAVDTVSMVNLRKDVTYTLVSELRDVETGLPLREGNSLTGKPLQTEKEFIATDSEMDVEVDVSFDATNFAGKTVVVFERLFEGDVEISSHTDLKDQKQQLRIMNPQLHTTAIDVTSGTHEGIAKKDVTIRDNVKYENIIPGDYILKGIVMDQQTGEPLLVNGKQITSEKKLTITEENGTVDMDFTFDASELNNKSIVIYEYLYQESELITSHEDINDKDQTVTFKVGSLQPNMPRHKGNGLFTALKTGDHIAIIPWILLALAGAGIVITMIGLRQKEKMESEEKDNQKK